MITHLSPSASPTIMMLQPGKTNVDTWFLEGICLTYNKCLAPSHQEMKHKVSEKRDMQQGKLAAFTEPRMISVAQTMLWSMTL